METEIPVVDYNYVKALDEVGNGTIIDVREPDELQTKGKIPTSVNIPLGQVSSAFAKTPEELLKEYGLRHLRTCDDEIVFHCQGGGRSQRAALAAKALGYTNVKNYKGSFGDWQAHESAAK